jgi:hypothetical protein
MAALNESMQAKGQGPDRIDRTGAKPERQVFVAPIRCYLVWLPTGRTLWLGKRRKSLKCLVGAVGLEPVWNFPCGRSQGPGKLDVQADPRPGLEGHRTAREAGIRHQAPHAWVDRTCSSVALDHHADPGAARLARFCVIYPPTFVRCYLIRYLSEVLAIPLMD